LGLTLAKSGDNQAQKSPCPFTPQVSGQMWSLPALRGSSR